MADGNSFGNFLALLKLYEGCGADAVDFNHCAGQELHFYLEKILKAHEGIHTSLLVGGISPRQTTAGVLV